MTTYTEEERQAVIERTYALLEQAEAERPERERDMAEREARRLAGDEDPLERSERLRRQYQEPEPEPRTAAKQRRSMDEREQRNLANFIRHAVERQVAAALRRERAELADVIGKTIVDERKAFRAINDGLLKRLNELETIREEFDARMKGIELRTADTAVLDLSAERARRSGSAA